MLNRVKRHPVVLSIGIVVWNEEDSLRPTLESLFRQSVFERLCIRHEQCEILVIAHACTDRTVAVAREVFAAMDRGHTWADAFTARVIEIPEAGEANAWNRFVHEFSAIEARFLCTVAPGIAFHHRDALHHLMATLEQEPQVQVAMGRACNQLVFQERSRLRERLTLAAAAMSGIGPRGPRGLCCLRALAARNLFIPRDLAGARDGFVDEMVSTQFLTRAAAPGRVAMVAAAAYLCEVSTRTCDLLNDRKRELMGGMAVRALVRHLHTLPREERTNLPAALRRRESADPDWLKRLVAEQIGQRQARLLPRGMLAAPWRALRRLPGVQRLARLPLAFAASLLNGIACVRAVRALRRAVEAYRGQPATPAVIGVPLG